MNDLTWFIILFIGFFIVSLGTSNLFGNLQRDKGFWIMFSLVVSLSASYGMTFYSSASLNNRLEEINEFISKCDNKYEVKIFNNDYQFICDKGVHTVNKVTFEEFNKATKADNKIDIQLKNNK